MSVDITAAPSKFAWRTSPRKRPPLSARSSPKKGKHTVSLKTAEIINIESQEILKFF